MSLAWTLLLLGGGGPPALRDTPPPGPLVREERIYYDLNALDLRTLRQEMQRRKSTAGLDGKAYGLTRQNLVTTYALQPLAEGCRLTALSMALDITIHLPRWLPPRPPPDDLQRRWNQMIDGLTRHEEGHRDNAVRAARELHDRLLSLGENLTCLHLERAARRAAFQAQVRYRLRDRNYDRQTRHGELQGSQL